MLCQFVEVTVNSDIKFASLGFIERFDKVVDSLSNFFGALWTLDQPRIILASSKSFWRGLLPKLCPFEYCHVKFYI